MFSRVTTKVLSTLVVVSIATAYGASLTQLVVGA